MKANELRLGNFVTYQDDKEMYQILCINSPIFEVTGQSNERLMTAKFNDFDPIPLTEEWLLKFRFEQIFSDLFRLDVHDFQFDLRIKEDHITVTICDGISLNPIKYVHQLQNLYFALTSEEIELVSLADEARR